jgi:excisionase family DNA binding protein
MSQTTSSNQPWQAADVGVQFEPLLDTAQAAALLRIHPKTLQKMARRGEVVGLQVGKLWRFRASQLNEWLERLAG